MKQLYHGDNLTIMRSMPDASVDLIATDPPFNTGKDWGAFDDRWEGGLKGYLKFMEERAVEMHRLLKDTGSLYLHCDPTASHYLKVMLDGVFGIKQFRNEIVWKRKNIQSNNVKLKFSNEHDVILFYVKTPNYTFNIVRVPLTEEQKSWYNKTDENGRKYSAPFGRITQGNPSRRKYLDEHNGVAIHSLWVDRKMTLRSTSKERLGYPTQKPVSLYERIIKASSNQHDIVLDPFCGSGTTLDAAKRLGRNYIGIDQNSEAIVICEKRLNPPQQELL